MQLGALEDNVGIGQVGQLIERILTERIAGQVEGLKVIFKDFFSSSGSPVMWL